MQIEATRRRGERATEVVMYGRERKNGEEWTGGWIEEDLRGFPLKLAW